MHVLVTGASGYIGSWVCRELAAAGHRVRAFVRPTSDLGNLHGLPIERATGDVLDGASVAGALDGCDAVVHTAGAVQWRDAPRLYAVNARAVEVVLGAALEAGVRRAVLTSSVAVMGGSTRPHVADESTVSNAEALGIDYFVSKLQGERAAVALAQRGLPLCVVRPGVVLGPGDRHRSSATTILALARRQFPIYVRGGASFCDVRDVARGHVAALQRGRIGEAYALGGHNLDMSELVQRVALAAGIPPPRLVPYPVALVAAAAAELYAKVGGGMRLSRQLVRASHLYTFVTSAKAQLELGYSIRPFDETLRDTLRWFIARGWLAPTTPALKALAT